MKTKTNPIWIPLLGGLITGLLIVAAWALWTVALLSGGFENVRLWRW